MPAWALIAVIALAVSQTVGDRLARHPRLLWARRVRMLPLAAVLVLAACFYGWGHPVLRALLAISIGALMMVLPWWEASHGSAEAFYRLRFRRNLAVLPPRDRRLRSLDWLSFGLTTCAGVLLVAIAVQWLLSRR
jgi:hypothetical protein